MRPAEVKVYRQYIMDVSQTEKTEESRTCLHIKLYHPQQSVQSMYRLLPLGRRLKHPAEDPLRLGRDAEACTFVLNDSRVSRKQLALQAFRTAHSSQLYFLVQNLSQRGSLAVNSADLGYLQWAQLPDKALLRFAGYELLLCQEPGEAKDSFEVQFEVAHMSPCQEVGLGIPCRSPVMDTGLQPSLYPNNSGHSQGPLEMDESCLSTGLFS
ncbi:TRAF-interacting protein with FHA domain-containing protein A isoform X1 [Brienomyrus brachyistius]|uniref:TRAF-interacting protein with FHA domain-containing protein A isoform X1 n=2 Tax=Brienomyrus brachyistius TaxID=42636 RepID=UPI0020B2AF5A|nr:TRAF-interacting protein with FHA domain-containing protein A isoform X1 [Brienomyrus brachyistius]